MIPASTLLCALAVGAPQRAGVSSVQDILVASPQQTSDRYEVRAGGYPVTVQRCDGREGALSYVHLVISGTARFTVTCRDSAGQWNIIPSESTLNLTKDADSVSFDLAPPQYLMIETAVDERLYILADPPEANPPKLSDPNTVSVLDYGIDSDGAELLTGKIQAAIDDLSARPGGGILVFPPGIYRTGTIRIKSGVKVYLAPRALLQGSPDPEHYPPDPGTTPVPDHTEDIRTRLILFDGVHDAAIFGHGEIDGMGHVLRAERHRVPNLIRVRRCKNIRIEGVTLRRAAGWNTHIFHSEDVIVRNVKILANWSDGIDIDNSRNVLVENVMSSSYDDSFCIKSTWFENTAKRVENIVLRNALLWTMKAAAKVGTETRCEAIENVALENVTIAGGREAFTIKCCDGALVRNLAYRDIDLQVAEHAENIILFEIRKRHGKGTIENILISGLNADKELGSHMAGLEQDHEITNVRFNGFVMESRPILTPESARLSMNAWVNAVVFE